MAISDELTRHLSKVRAKKLPITIREVLYADNDDTVAVLVGFADGSAAGCLIPEDMLSEDNIRISAVAMAAVWEMLSVPTFRYKRKGKSGDEVISLDE